VAGSRRYRTPASTPVHAWRAWLLRFGREWAAVVALGTLALLGAAKVGEDVMARESTAFDDAVQHWVLAHQSAPLLAFFLFVTRVGGIGPMTGLAVLGAGNLWVRGKRRVAAGVLVAPVVAVLLFNVVKRVYARVRPVGLGGIVPSSYSFPSGHATASTAICCTLAYVYWREGWVRRSTAVTFAIGAPALIGVSRVYLNVHWATDVIGGWCAGLLVAVLCTLLYDRHRSRPENVPSSAIPRTHPTTS
jgi:membrane-associated phospholipid phosphatase